MTTTPRVPVCLTCSHKHQPDTPCANHQWADTCPYIGTQCPTGALPPLTVNRRPDVNA